LQVFLLSPAYCGGRRAGYLMRPGSQMALATRLADGTLTLGEAFAFMSGLYFRGKLAYATRFGRAINGPASPVQSVHVITPTRGLVPPGSLVTTAILQEFAAVDVHADDARYRRPLDESCLHLREALPAETRVVLLGSIATGKYVDALTRIFGEQLHFPADFVGRGDMSRGGLMLRSVAAGVELEYTPLRPEAVRHGARPPKLPPLRAPISR
jgi:hypothetical protein